MLPLLLTMYVSEKLSDLDYFVVNKMDIRGQIGNEKHLCTPSDNRSLRDSPELNLILRPFDSLFHFLGNVFSPHLEFYP